MPNNTVSEVIIRINTVLIRILIRCNFLKFMYLYTIVLIFIKIYTI